MQSYLQYRKIGREADQQLQRHAEAGLNAKELAATSLGSSLSEASRPTADGSAVTPERTRHELQQVMTGIRIQQHQQYPNDVFVIQFEQPYDSLDPHTWKNSPKVGVTVILSLICVIVSWATACDSGALVPWAKGLGVSPLVESIPTATYLIGFGIGSLLCAPVSETVGRNPVYITCLAVFTIFTMASALSPNIGAQITFRFIAGLFGSPPLVCAGGSLADIWTPTERTLAFAIYGPSAFLGPTLGPMVGGWIGQSTLVDYRWTSWITLILASAVLVVATLFLPETYAPVLLKWRAAHLRSVSGDNRYKSALEVEGTSFWTRLGTSLTRPFELLFRELIVLLIAIYITVVWMILYGFLIAFSFIFGETYHYSSGQQGTVFVAVAVGFGICLTLTPAIYSDFKKQTAKAEAAGNGARVPPEIRLWYAMYTAPLLPISLFWVGWTNYSWISSWAGIGATCAFGIAIMGIFLSCTQYLIDVYGVLSASALAGTIFLRFIVAGGMTIVSFPMYENLGVHWTCTLLGCLSALMTPVPYLFYIYGRRIREKSKFAGKH